MAISQDRLTALLSSWKLLLQAWSADGRLSAAAQEALLLGLTPEQLVLLTSQWAGGDFNDLPPIELLAAEAMPGAAAAYAASTGTIYLNENWLASATDEEVLRALTEELGHHLDAILNPADSPGDEGELFARVLLDPDLSASDKAAIRSQNDSTLIQVDGQWIAAEAAVITGTPLADTLIGGFGDDAIDGLGGNDVIDGQAGSDTISGGDGNDTIEGNFGNDTLFGDAGDDIITDDQGSNLLDGGSGNDNLTSRSLSGNHTLIGGLGNDVLSATGVNISLDGGDGNDFVVAIGSLNIGGTRQFVQSGVANLIGGTGADDIQVQYYSTANLIGGDDNDLLSSVYTTNSSLSGGAGDDFLRSTFDVNATLNGGDGNDSLSASDNGGAELFGGLGDDLLNVVIGSSNQGYQGGDYRLPNTALLDGGDGNDILSASGIIELSDGSTVVTAIGGLGDDTISITENTNNARFGYTSLSVDAGDGVDTITVAGSFSTTITTGAGIDTIVLTTAQYNKLLVGAQLLANPDGTSTAITPEPFIVTDFTTGAGGDIVDYGDLLRNATTTYDGSNPFSTGFLALTQNGSDTLLSFDPDGAAVATGSPTVLAIFQNTTAAAFTADNFNPNFPVNENPASEPVLDAVSLRVGFLDAAFSADLPAVATGQLQASTADGSAVTFDPSDQQGVYGSFSTSVDGITTYSGDNAAITAQATSTLTDSFSITATNGTASTTADYVVSIANPTAENTLLIDATASGSIDGIGFGSTAATGAYAGTLLNSINLGSSADTASLADAAGTTAALSLDGGDGFDRLNGNASANTLTLTGLDSGTLDLVSFTSIENVYLLGGDDTVVINAGGRLSGILDGGAGSNTLQVDASLDITFNGDNTITVGDGSTGGGGGTFSGFQNIQVTNNPGGGGGAPQTNTITLNANASTALITGPNSGTVDGTGFTNISDINLAAGDDNAVLAATGSLTGTLDGGAGTADSLTVNAEANTLTINQTGSGSIGTAGNAISTAIAGFETIRLDSGSDTANLNFGETAPAASRQLLSIDGGTDSGQDASTDTLRITLSDADFASLQASNTLEAFNAYITNPAGVTFTASLANTDLTLTGFESAELISAPPPPTGVELSTPDITARAGSTISIPINIDQAGGLEAFELSFSYDPSILSIPTTGLIVSAGDLNPTASVVANTATPGLIIISAAGNTPLAAGSGSIATLNLQVASGAVSGTTLLNLTSASLNEGTITASLVDGVLTLRPPTYQVLGVRELPTGLALQLPEAPDLLAFNLYDGADAAIDLADLQLIGADGTPVALSAHWQASTSELYLLAADALAPGAYSLSIDSRADGLISGSTGELLDGNADGVAGGAFSYGFSAAAALNAISIADTARGAGQALSINGTAGIGSGITGLPVRLNTSGSITELSGVIRYEQGALENLVLRAGSDLPADWTLSLDITSQPGAILFSASGSTAISGNNLELFRLDGDVSAATLSNGRYGSSTLIEINASSTSNPALTFISDPGLVALAYSGDTTGNGTLSSLDASRVQRVVVNLDSGFDAFSSINPTLIGDTTGNGALSSLDASRIQQKVVGLQATSFPDLTPVIV